MTDIINALRIESRREPHEPIWRDAIDEIEALRAEVDALREDAARYRWLRDWSKGVPDGQREIYVTQHALPHDDDDMDIDLFDGALDDAIDAARKKG